MVALLVVSYVHPPTSLRSMNSTPIVLTLTHRSIDPLIAAAAKHYDKGCALRFWWPWAEGRTDKEFTMRYMRPRRDKVHRNTFDVQLYRDAFPRGSNGSNSATKPATINKEAEI